VDLNASSPISASKWASTCITEFARFTCTGLLSSCTPCFQYLLSELNIHTSIAGGHQIPLQIPGYIVYSFLSSTTWMCIIFTWSGAYHDGIFLVKYPVDPNSETMACSIVGKLNLQDGMYKGVRRLRGENSKKTTCTFQLREQSCIQEYSYLVIRGKDTIASMLAEHVKNIIPVSNLCKATILLIILL